MNELLTALALAVAIEGIIYALFPKAMRRFISQVLEMSDGALRWSGLIAAILGCLAVAMLRRAF